MKALSVIGTLAMFLVGGGIISHAVPLLHHLFENMINAVELIPTIGNILGPITSIFMNLVIGLIAGLIVLFVVSVIQKLRSKEE